MSTRLLAAPAAAPVRKPKWRRRRRFSLNGLAIQLSAFALSFTLVALLVVSGSQAAFVEESEALANYVPIGTTAPPPPDDEDWLPPSPRSPTASPSVTPPPAVEADEEEPEPPSVVVQLADSDAGTAMFGQETTLAPGVASERCIEVVYDGNVDSRPVLLYAAAAIGELAPYLDLTIEMGDATSGAFGDCGAFTATEALYSGTLADFAATHADYATGLPTWDPGEDAETHTFRFTVAVQDHLAAEGKSVAFGFSWETRAE